MTWYLTKEEIWHLREPLLLTTDSYETCAFIQTAHAEAGREMVKSH